MRLSVSFSYTSRGTNMRGAHLALHRSPDIVQTKEGRSALCADHSRVLELAPTNDALHDIVEHAEPLQYSVELAKEGPEKVHQDLGVELHERG